jgi:glycosyl transferase family 2
MRAIAILATYNEERFIAGCLDNLIRQGLQVYLIDNDSTDSTVTIAERFSGRGLIGIETLPRAGVFSLRQQLARKETLAATLDADWFIHVDADQIILPARSTQTLAQALAEVDGQGYNAVYFHQFAFVPTQDDPDHDHPDYQQTMRWYYPHEESFPHSLRAWKRQETPVELNWSGGHRVRFPGLRMYPSAFRYRHYLFLSIEHAIRKYVQKRFDPAEVADGWHTWRTRLSSESIRLPSRAELRYYESDDTLDHSFPRKHCFVDDAAIETALHLARKREEKLAGLYQALAGRDDQLTTLKQELAQRGGHLSSLNQTLIGREAQIANLSEELAQRDGHLNSLNQTLIGRDAQIANLSEKLGQRDGHLNRLTQTLIQRDAQLARLSQEMTERDEKLAGLRQALAERDQRIAGLSQLSAELTSKITHLTSSRSWRLTRPLRLFGRILRGELKTALRGFHHRKNAKI